MKITYDPEVDALYICFKDTTVATQNMADGVAIDYDENGLIAGIEILDASRKLGDKQFFKQVTLENVA